MKWHGGKIILVNDDHGNIDDGPGIAESEKSFLELESESWVSKAIW